MNDALSNLSPALRGGARAQNPLDRDFNVFVHRMARKLFPCGFDVTMDEDEAPSNLIQLQQHVEKTGRMLVWGGASDNTIFDCRETNWAFRAWHDWCHLRGKHPFHLVGEEGVMLMQQRHCRLLVPEKDKAERFCRILWLEVMGQAAHYERTGAFPENQMEWMEQQLAQRASS